MSDTIFALSSGVGRAAIAVIRLSGPAVRFVLETMTGDVPEPRRAVLRPVVDPHLSERLDQALILFFPGPHSFTGQDVAEFQVHGGRAVVQGMLAALAACPGCRLAQPGEFSRRALANGRLDLARVEGIGDLIAAETPQQRRQALAQAEGLLSRHVDGWRQILLGAMAELEAAIDFADEGDVQESLGLAALMPLLRQLRGELAQALGDGRRGEILRDGLTVVIAGPPNAGKSTLLNALARREVAIVSDVPGTTRDVLEVHLDVEGYPVTLLDTAGIRDTSDAVEAIGVQRAVAEGRRADLVLWLSTASDPVTPPSDWGAPLLSVVTQIDSSPKGPEDDLAVSALTGAGLADLVRRIATFAAGHLGGEPALVTRERHRQALATALEALDRALVALSEGRSPEWAAEDLRLASRSLGHIIGVVDAEQVLDSLFASFCIGK